MNENGLGQELDAVISSACERLVDDFSRLRSSLVAVHPELENKYLAANLMEFGRGQISGIDEPTDSDREFIADYVESIEVHGELAYQFCAYVSGCVLGWVISGQLSRGDMIPALAAVQARSMERYPEDEG